ncbi:hypothetical protein [Paenibacillus hemerocallicola]|jgi:hypothetical protein|uniref:hypothetical protein n=1 Tax=Paenibacillus hemerocallicola TaxID=1172614 RepID=UPI00159EDCDD|nr:hypothetical protein [Paenibacillus hemerocallicola]
MVEIDHERIRLRTVAIEDDAVLRCARFLYDRLKGFHRPGETTLNETEMEVRFKE